MIAYLKIALRAAMLLALFIAGPFLFACMMLSFAFGDASKSQLAFGAAFAALSSAGFMFLKRSSFLKPPDAAYSSLRLLFSQRHDLRQLSKDAGAAMASTATQAVNTAAVKVRQSRSRMEEENQRQIAEKANLLKVIQSLSSGAPTANCRIAGIGCVMTIHQNKVTIAPSGVFGFVLRGLKGVKSIPIDSITATQFKPATFSFRGYLQFTIYGGNESTGGLLSATRDENTFLFDGKENNELIEAVQTHVHRMMAHMRGRGSITAPQQPNLAEGLQKLIQMKNDGMLSDEEFTNAKSRLIDDA